MEKMIEQIRAAGVVPVVKIDDAKDAVALAEALREGGLNCAEVTFRTDAAEEAIRLMAEKYPDMLVAAAMKLVKDTAVVEKAASKKTAAAND